MFGKHGQPEAWRFAPAPARLVVKRMGPIQHEMEIRKMKGFTDKFDTDHNVSSKSDIKKQAQRRSGTVPMQSSLGPGAQKEIVRELRTGQLTHVQGGMGNLFQTQNEVTVFTTKYDNKGRPKKPKATTGILTVGLQGGQIHHYDTQTVRKEKVKSFYGENPNHGNNGRKK